MLKIQKLHKSYPIGETSLHVLKGIDLSVEKGEMVAIMGSSGSGKSTFLNIIGMLDEAEWSSMLKSFKTLFRSPYHLKLWSFMRETFDEEFVVIVDQIIEELFLKPIK